MAVEVYQSVADSSYNIFQNPAHDYPQEGWEMASFFSASANFAIIDSYSAAAGGRYKGDPITGGGPMWASKLDVSATNAWFIIESIGSPTSPQWQAKIQWTNNTTGFADPSGVDYGFEGQTYKVLIRFAPNGGWNLADTNPDFNPTGYPTNPTYRSANNYYFHAGWGTGGPYRWFFVADSGQLLRFSRKNTIPYQVWNWCGYYGDITPIDPTADTMPRVAIPYLTNPTYGYASIGRVQEADCILSGDSYVNPWASYSGMAFQDRNGDWIETGQMMPTATHILNSLTQYNQFDSIPRLDTLPFYVITTSHGMLGTLPLCERAYGPGFTLVNSKQYLSTRAGYCLLIKWDGSTILNV